MMLYRLPIETALIALQAGGQEMASPASQKYKLVSEGGGTYKVAGGEQINVSSSSAFCRVLLAPSELSTSHHHIAWTYEYSGIVV